MIQTASVAQRNIQRDNRKIGGHTLIEAMTVITIIALLVLAGSPMTGKWVNGADIARTEGNLSQAIGHAKSLALRNPAGAINQTPAAAICISNTNKLTVLQHSGTSAPSCTGPAGVQSWETQLDSDVSIYEMIGTTASTTGVACMCFNNKGLITQTSCTTCASNTTFKLEAGSKYEIVSLH